MLIVPFWYLFGTLLVPKVATGMDIYITLAKYLEREGITGILYFYFDSLFKH